MIPGGGGDNRGWWLSNIRPCKDMTVNNNNNNNNNNKKLNDQLKLRYIVEIIN